MNIEDAMHPKADWASADMPVSEVARMMVTDDIGAVPVGKDDRLIGMLTDRDPAIRVVAARRDPDRTLAEQVMSPGIALKRCGRCRTFGPGKAAARLSTPGEAPRGVWGLSRGRLWSANEPIHAAAPAISAPSPS